MSRATSGHRRKIVEACATIARAVATTSGGEAHTVQLMLRDPEFRRNTIHEALRRATPHQSDGMISRHRTVESFNAVQNAANILRAYDGAPL
jgi:hypothetical protein